MALIQAAASAAPAYTSSLQVPRFLLAQERERRIGMEVIDVRDDLLQMLWLYTKPGSQRCAISVNGGGRNPTSYAASVVRTAVWRSSNSRTNVETSPPVNLVCLPSPQCIQRFFEQVDIVVCRLGSSLQLLYFFGQLSVLFP